MAGIPYHGQSIRDKKYLYVEWSNEEAGELAATALYDLVWDPQGNRNVAYQPEYADAVKKMAGRHKAGWQEELPD